jgi:hypothetical protein
MGPELLNRADASIVAKFYSRQKVEAFHQKKKKKKVLLPAENFKGLRFILSLPKEPSSYLYSRKSFTRDRRVVVNLKSGLCAPGDYGHYLSLFLRTWVTRLATHTSRRRGSVLNIPKTSMRVEEFLSFNRQPLFFKLLPRTHFEIFKLVGVSELLLRI